ncbi:hypothetical protein Y032_0237g3274 [Ancylostoma ceylanicum]|uniref:Uncharacterized protein n=1 Tax=Ancylostoma ceylanicum TaxID=53326 RepID=A0A016SET9_9BILA|nr:hypothetical protein Y032_0237g3274 [Ancylostoma ceylanicum]
MGDYSASPPSDERKVKQRKSKKKGSSPESSLILGSVNQLQQKGELGRTRTSTVQAPQAKQLKSGPLYQRGAIALAEKVKGRKPLKSKSRVRYMQTENSDYLTLGKGFPSFTIGKRSGANSVDNNGNPSAPAGVSSLTFAILYLQFSIVVKRGVRLAMGASRNTCSVGSFRLQPLRVSPDFATTATWIK